MFSLLRSGEICVFLTKRKPNKEDNYIRSQFILCFIVMCSSLLKVALKTDSMNSHTINYIGRSVI